MNKKQADKIIENYKPHDGFFDLSKKPESLTIIEYAKALKTQNFLASYRGKEKYMKENHLSQWHELQNLSAQLQQFVFEHWGDSVFA